MPGFELFDQREIDALADVIRRKMVHRYSFVNCRDEIYRVEEFENAVAAKFGVRHCQAVSSGTASLYVALKAMGVGPGDEIITTPFTFIASVEAILECGAVPVLAEIDESLNLDPTVLEEYITDRTRGIMPVHMFGAAADLEGIQEVCTEYGVPLLEDSCQAMGATYRGKAVGTLGLWGTYSLDPYKILTVGEGGLVVTNSEDLYHRMEYYADHGHIHSKTIDRGAEEKACLGFNFRLSELQGALGLVQISKFDDAVARLRQNKKRILEGVGAVEGLSLRKLPDRDGEIATQLVLLLPDAAKAKDFQTVSKDAGVGCGLLSENVWHYARHWQTLREGMSWSRVRCPFDCPHAPEALPLYRPVEWPQTQSILSRALCYGIDMCMSDDRIENTVEAIRAAARAVL